MAHFYRPEVSSQLGSTPPGSLGLAEDLGPFTFGEAACPFLGLARSTFLLLSFLHILSLSLVSPRPKVVGTPLPVLGLLPKHSYAPKLC